MRSLTHPLMTQDARFMATNDLCAELQKDIKMDVNMVCGCVW